MEEEKPQPPPDHPQLEPADQGAADVPIYYHVTIFDEEDDAEEEEEEEDDVAATKFWAVMEEGTDFSPKKKVWADWKDRAAAIAADEAMAHQLYLQEISKLDEWELRDVDDFDLPSSSSSRAGVGARATFESVHEAESGAEFLGNSRIPGPLEALADERIREIRGTKAASRGAGTSSTSVFWRPGPRDFATTPARRTAFSKDGAGSSSSTEHDPVSTKRRALLAEADSAMVFAGMEDWHDNSWYEDVPEDDDEDEKPEQVEVQSLAESLQSCRMRSEPRCNPAAAAQGNEFSLQDFCQKWGVAPSDMQPDEPGPSTRVPPLADDEVPTFDCGICRDTLLVLDLFHGLPCKHRFCAPCMTAYVEGRIRAGELPIPCPNTKCNEGAVLHPEKCKKAIDYAAFGDWGARLVESAVPPNRRAYCPNRRCRLMVETTGVAEQVMAPCPACGHALVRKLAQDWLA